MSSHTVLVVSIVACCAVASGCSLGVRRLPKTWDRSAEPACSSSGLAPTVDAAVAVPTLLIAGSSAPHLCSEGQFCSLGTLVFITSLVTGLAYGASSVSGYLAMAQCDRANKAHRAWLSLSAPRRRARGWVPDARTRPGIATQLRRDLRQADEARAPPTASSKVDVNIAGQRLTLRTDGRLCLRLTWAAIVRQLKGKLRALGVRQVRCSSGGFVVWHGPIDALPERVSETRCGPLLASLKRARQQDPARHALLTRDLPGACDTSR